MAGTYVARPLISERTCDGIAAAREKMRMNSGSSSGQPRDHLGCAQTHRSRFVARPAGKSALARHLHYRIAGAMREGRSSPLTAEWRGQLPTCGSRSSGRAQLRHPSGSSNYDREGKGSQYPGKSVPRHAGEALDVSPASASRRESSKGSRTRRVLTGIESNSSNPSIGDSETPYVHGPRWPQMLDGRVFKLTIRLAD